MRENVSGGSLPIQAIHRIAEWLVPALPVLPPACAMLVVVVVVVGTHMVLLQNAAVTI